MQGFMLQDMPAPMLQLSFAIHLTVPITQHLP